MMILAAPLGLSVLLVAAAAPATAHAAAHAAAQVNAEIYPLHVRGLGQSAATTANWASNFAISASFLTAAHLVGKAAVFGFFALVCFGGAAWLHVALPETSGLSLEAIAALFVRPGDDEYEAEGAGGGYGGLGDGGFGGSEPEVAADSGGRISSDGGGSAGNSPTRKPLLGDVETRPGDQAKPTSPLLKKGMEGGV